MPLDVAVAVVPVEVAVNINEPNIHVSVAGPLVEVAVRGMGARGPAGIAGPAGVVQSIVAGSNVTIDATDPAHPIVASTGGGGGADTDIYVHTQAVPATVWTIAHGLGMFPNVTTVDSLLREFEADVDYVDSNTLTVTVAIATAGSAYLS